jgi:SAM-dependent methyltransferase
MTVTTPHAERLKREQEWHDKVYRRVTVTPGRGAWTECETPTYADEPKRSPTMTKRLLSILGDFAGKRVLIYGCGNDPGATWFAKRGAKVTAIDISPEAIKNQRILMDAYKVLVYLSVADAMRTPFADRSFDLIIGNAILHHLDSEQCAREIARLLEPGGVAVFREVQSGNIFLQLFRFFTPFWRTPDEHPLNEGDYAMYRRYFGKVDVSGHVLTSMLYLFAHRMFVTGLRKLGVRWWPPQSARALALFDRLDNLLQCLPGMKSQMWLCLIEMRLERKRTKSCEEL